MKDLQKINTTTGYLYYQDGMDIPTQEITGTTGNLWSSAEQEQKGTVLSKHKT